MPREHLTDDTRLDIALSATISREQYTTMPEVLVHELQRLAGGRGDILAKVAGTWAGFHENDPLVRPLVDALWEIPGATNWIEVGRESAGGQHRGRY
ncbi:hypothetical protein [Microbacterium karelineae]|uniref:hypothetical protein n=1 Tax=Microbacterium karelineae TaxID=2654283 RepID=UPI0012EA8B94|nr:hypothetical protein [Microbacterium karelineae]